MEVETQFPEISEKCTNTDFLTELNPDENCTDTKFDSTLTDANVHNVFRSDDCLKGECSHLSRLDTEEIDKATNYNSNSYYVSVKNQAVFTVNIISTILTPEGLNYIRTKTGTNYLNCYLTMSFYQHEFSTGFVKLENDMLYNCERKYVINDCKVFFEQLKSERVVEITLIVYDDNDFKTKYTIGSGNADFKELLSFPHNRIFSRIYLQLIEDPLADNPVIDDDIIGVTLFWYEIKCDMGVIDKYLDMQIKRKYSLSKNLPLQVPQLPKKIEDNTVTGIPESKKKESRNNEIIENIKTELILISVGQTESVLNCDDIQEFNQEGLVDFYKIEENKESFKSNLNLCNVQPKQPSVDDFYRPGQSQEFEKSQSKEGTGEEEKPVNVSNTSLKNFADMQDLIVIRNTALDVSQSAISEELNERIDWLQEECDWRRTLQEDAILRGIDPQTIEWRQWRDSYTKQIAPRKYTNETEQIGSKLKIIIHSFRFFKESPVLTYKKFNQVFIEYSFLDIDDVELETPFSLPKPSPKMEPLEFNFEKEFDVDPVENKHTATLLAKCVKDNTAFHFFVIYEPAENVSGSAECEEIGCTRFTYYDLVSLKEDIIEKEFPVQDVQRPGEQIGMLKLSFIGIKAARNAALTVMKPYDFHF